LREDPRLRVFEKRVLRRIFGSKRDEVTGEWRKLHNEELNDVFSSPNSVQVKKIKKNEMGGACSAYGGEERFFCGGNLRERDHLEGSDVDGRIILRWIFRKCDVGLRNGSSWLRIVTGSGQL